MSNDSLRLFSGKGIGKALMAKVAQVRIVGYIHWKIQRKIVCKMTRCKTFLAVCVFDIYLSLVWLLVAHSWISLYWTGTSPLWISTWSRDAGMWPLTSAITACAVRVMPFNIWPRETFKFCSNSPDRSHKQQVVWYAQERISTQSPLIKRVIMLSYHILTVKYTLETFEVINTSGITKSNVTNILFRFIDLFISSVTSKMMYYNQKPNLVILFISIGHLVYKSKDSEVHCCSLDTSSSLLVYLSHTQINTWYSSEMSHIASGPVVYIGPGPVSFSTTGQ